MHGGRSPRGRESPNFKHGLYSKHVGPELKAILDELDQDEELMEVERDVKLLTGLVLRAEDLEDHRTDLATLSGLAGVLDILTRMKQRQQRLQIEQRRLIKIEHVTEFLRFTRDVLTRHLEDGQATDILNEIKAFRLEEI